MNQKVYVEQEVQNNYHPKKVVQTRANGTKKVSTVHEGPSLAQQQFKDDCDVNKILEKFNKTGTLSHVRNGQTGVYADLTSLPDYDEALRTIITAENAFKDIPAQVRKRFDNDPKELIKFLSDPSNKEEAIKLGLMVRVEVPKDYALDALQQIAKNTSTVEDSKK